MCTCKDCSTQLSKTDLEFGRCLDCEVRSQYDFLTDEEFAARLEDERRVQLDEGDY
jgi:hypothetical protein